MIVKTESENLKDKKIRSNNQRLKEIKKELKL
jgi:hypothetical protein